jgi:hypothetical protein
MQMVRRIGRGGEGEVGDIILADEAFPPRHRTNSSVGSAYCRILLWLFAGVLDRFGL